TDKHFHHVVESRNVKAKSSHDGTLQTNVRGLRPGKHYFYRFVMGKKKSKVGQFDTAPKSNKSPKVTFAWSGDADAQPTRGSSKRGIYRTFRWGKNVELFFLDERSFRDAKASANHVCDNPQTHQPDLAPTAPQHTRNTFALLVPSLAQPVSPACIQKINDPNRDFLGASQLKQFEDDVKSSSARFKV